ncbi:hypothetical protein BDW59DRAFT_163668 [Aspergillus cavernicola]|uniref:Uncharacterized protein n=1 Tax=Aspergillus cavernicola TaxID=176166 RepID=A0ABR4I4Y6_9EURO
MPRGSESDMYKKLTHPAALHSSSGSATRTSPVSWTNTSLRDVFAAPYTRPIATWYPDNNTTNRNTTTTTPSSDGNSSGFPAWAGGLIDALLGLLVIAGLTAAWLTQLRRKHKGSQQQSKPSSVFALSVPAEVPSSSRPIAEAASEPLYEMHDAGHAAELPTQNDETAMLTPSLVLRVPSAGHTAS